MHIFEGLYLCRRLTIIQSILPLPSLKKMSFDIQIFLKLGYRWLSGKNPHANAGDSGDMGSIPGSGRSPLGGGKATYSSILAWKIPWTEKPGGLQSMGLPGWTPLSNWAHTHTHSCITKVSWVLLYSEVSQLYVHIYPLLLGSHSDHHPTHLGHNRALSSNLLNHKIIRTS